MKIRNGFVSNSSSSSFIIVGIELRELPIELEELEDYIIYNDFDGKYYIGKIVVDTPSDNNVLEDGCIDIKKEVEEAKEILKEHNLDGKIKIYYGTRAS